jgi:NodT family efflux transporter outer membrane factor (OMF) lipoprotein
LALPSRFRRAVPLVLLGCLAGCTVGPDFEKPKAWWQPGSWFGGHAPPPVRQAISEPVAEPVDPAWWTLFHDPQLSDLENRVAGANLDLQVAVLRLAESRASLSVARADVLPSLNANGNYTRQQLSKKGALSLFGGGGPATASSKNSGAGAGGLPGTPQSGTPGTASNGLSGTNGASQNTSLFAPFDLFQYGLDASWEIDFWGRVKRNLESADASVIAAGESQRDVLLTALAEVARDYIQLRGVQRNLEITQRNLGTARQSLRLTQDRAAGGLTTELDVANAAAQVANTASQIPNLQAQEQQLINAIALLLGQPPQSLQAELLTPHPIPPVPPRVPVGLPSELARRRPDIRRAEAQLHAATADVGVAVADFYPRVTLSGSAAIQATQFKDLGSWAQANTWSFGPSITLPIFQGGRLRGVLALRKAQQQEAAITYQRTVLGALHDVDNALIAYQSEQGRRNQLEQATAQNRRALKLAQDRYAQGVADFLTVLDAERSLLAAEQMLTDSTTTVSTDLVQIYKALGGGWESKIPDMLPGPPASQPSVVKDFLL